MHQSVLPFRRPQRPYHATTPLTQQQLAGAMRTAEQQDEAVLAIFRATQQPMAPSQVWQVGIDHGRRWLLTSVRRSITNLADENCRVLVKLQGQSRPGPYGKPEGLWCLPDKRRIAA